MIKRTLTFFEYVMRDILIRGLIIGVIFFALEQFSFTISLDPRAGSRFANEIDGAHFRLIFISALLFSMFSLVLGIIRRFIGSKGIYGLCMMPVPKGALFASWFVSGVLAIMILILFRYLSVFCAYLQYAHAIRALIAEKAASGITSLAKIENGALLSAYLRSEHLKVFLPFDLRNGVILFFIVFSLPALAIRFALSIFAKKLPLSIIFVILWVIFFLLSGESEFLGLVGMLFVSIFSFISAKNMAGLGQML